MSDRRVVGRVARLHFENGLTHQEIAKLFNLSRVKVTRLLAEARQTGIVEITVHSDERPFFEVEKALADRFGLKGVWVSPPIESADSSNQPLDGRVLGVTGAEAMQTMLGQAKRVVIGLSAAVSSSAQHLPEFAAPELEIFPLAGGRAGRASGSNPQELVATVATATGGQGFQLPAPLIAADSRVYEALMDMAGCAAVLDEAAQADLLIVGVGTSQKVAPVFRQQVSQTDLEEIAHSAAVGDISARFFDAAGQALEEDLDSRVIGLSLAQMGRISHRLGIAGGLAKVDAVRGAVVSGLINYLVTDLACAQALLRDPE
ncbi:sugar-binding transcriptional regulator [Brevibacterium marinum]|uniref:Lsr operon transcriptional repressor n=1 Tax=Brevibacterium marinum TaxID=418643 RepID=A0A846RYJ9_9MICO|nr:sugar-binding domain-containing protein [Brevibacterium marinum]NJC57016.1 lsr operon transcriptional repressor [Brevibacterium marinum]